MAQALQLFATSSYGARLGCGLLRAQSAALLLLCHAALVERPRTLRLARALAMRSAAPAGCRAAPLARFAAGSRQLPLCVARSRAPCRPPRAVVQAPACAAPLLRGVTLLRCTAASPIDAARRSLRLCASLGSKVRGCGAPAALADSALVANPKPSARVLCTRPAVAPRRPAARRG